MKRYLWPILMSILSVIALLLFFHGLDSAMEIDNLKEQIGLQRKEMRFLDKVASAGFSSCHLTVAEFEKIAKESGREVLWNGDDGLAGALKVQRKDSCIVRVTTADWL